MKLVIALLTFVVLSGCASAPQQPIQLQSNVFAPSSTRIGIAMTELPKQSVQLPGADCLLCILAATAANSGLSTHIQTLSYENLSDLKKDIAGSLSKHGVEVLVIDENLNLDKLKSISSKEPGTASKDFTIYKTQYNIDKLLVIDIAHLGMIRTYASYFPTSDPKATINGAGFLVNLSSNSYEWYLPINITKSADVSWDEPPKYPGLTNAYYQVIELSKDSFSQPFANLTTNAAATFDSSAAQVK